MTAARRLAVVLTWLVALPVLGVGVARALPTDEFLPLPQVVGLVPWAALATVPVLLLAAITGRRFLVVLLIVALGTFAFWVSPFWWPSTSVAADLDPEDPGTLRVLTVNALYGRVDADSVVAVVRNEHVEVLAVQELTPELRDRLAEAGLDELLPYNVTDRLDEPAAGTGLWASTELREVDQVPGTAFAMPSALVDAGGTDVRVTVVHPVPPLPGNTGQWHSELAAVGDSAHAEETPQILLGDFNATYDHASFRAVLGDRFQDATRAWGTGPTVTWPVGRQLPPLPLFALDHVVVERSMQVSDVVTVTVPGTDHRAVLATVGVS
ncbi:endonuclease/exonuclease/phosphatase family protein [Antribacter sp. KLBMP9083]|uniref:Endonuclease/exonuclease/phosphatase family protein n=1 Tax=Antribacter soli TaxID=2910976 RepID=A0AA41QAE2_9MICO|nr:endonuclease/exonuclease/phosphatase family protein [Antribacter soli]MCF4119648.1 endonuclease/exonuclease/phosphatase family protein [Antribacter soli]